MKVPFTFKALFSLPLSLILSQRLAQNYVSADQATISSEDLLLGLGVGVFISLFFSAAMKVSVFFADTSEDDSAEENPWRQIIDSFFFVFIIMLFMALRLEKNLLEVLAIEHLSAAKLMNMEVWAAALTDMSWLALKVSSFGFLFSLTKTLFEEVYRRLGGESLKIVFSICTWLALLVMSPLLIPSFTSFISNEMSEFWKKWLGVSV